MAAKRWSMMLSEAIEEKGLLLRELSAQCGKRKARIDLSSLSRMRQGLQLPPATDDGLRCCRILAEILGIDEREFILALCMERTPDVVLKALQTECLIDIHDLSERACIVLKTRPQR